MGKPIFKEGDVIRYTGGPTALMQVDTILPNHGGPGVHYYCGEHCLGGSHCAYEDRAKPADDEDMATWRAHAADRRD